MTNATKDDSAASQRPSPLDFALRAEEQKARGSLAAISAQLRESFPTQVWVAEQAGSNITEDIETWVRISGRDAVADWVANGTNGGQLARRWKEALSDSTLPLLACLVHEEQLSTNAARVSTYFRGFGLSLETALMNVRERVAKSALDSAFRASWARRTVFAQALYLARTYLDFLLEAARLDGVEPPRSLVARYGISTVLSARFAPITRSELAKACLALISAHENGADNALVYFLEGCVWKYDLFDDRGALLDASERIRAGNSSITRSAAWYLNCAEVWTKLVGCTSNLQVRRELLRRASGALEDVRHTGSLSSEEAARLVMSDALLGEFEAWMDDSQSDFVVRGVSFPFGHRTTHLEVSAAYRRAAPAIAKALSRSHRSAEFVFRDVTAELRSYLARFGDLSAADIRWNLRTAIQSREGSKGATPLRGFRIELAQAEDQLLLAKLTGESGYRRRALMFLATRGSQDSSDAAKLTVLARDLETQGALLGPLLEADPDLAIAVRNGDAAAVYQQAASLAVRSPDVTRIALGGRGGVVVLRDAENAAGQTFVFKRMSRAALGRDSARTERLSVRISEMGLEDKFGFIEHMMTMNQHVPGLSKEADDSVVSIRRFNSGLTLKDHLEYGSGVDRGVLDDVVAYLAFMHSISTDGDQTTNVRKVLWSKEVGRWLRPLGFGEKRNDVFDEWWRIFQGAMIFPRRDAHAMNWLVDTAGKILAVDLDATGARPFGYELAQLMEDTPILAANDWEARLAIFNHYCRSLERFGVTLSQPRETLELQYRASVLARALWILSNPDSDASGRVHAGELLLQIYRQDSESTTGKLALKLSRKWAEKTGVATGARVDLLADADRRRISRAMAYQLRHNPAAPATKDGWVHVDELTELLTQNGHRVTSQQVIFIAGALGEPRFELEGSEIRASYGHSRSTSIHYESKKPPPFLFHATPMENLSSVLEAQAGLVRGKRQWVHLTDSCEVAERTSRRQGRPVVVLRIRADKVPSLVFASGHTWLADRVAADAIEVLSVRGVAELLRSDSGVVTA